MINNTKTNMQNYKIVWQNKILNLFSEKATSYEQNIGSH